MSSNLISIHGGPCQAQPSRSRFLESEGLFWVILDDVYEILKKNNWPPQGTASPLAALWIESKKHFRGARTSSGPSNH